MRRVRTDPGHFRSGRRWLLAEGVLVSAFGIAGLISSALQPHAGPTGAPVLGFATTPTHSAVLLALGLVAIAAVGNRRAAVTVTALSVVAYMMLLFFSSVASARAKPTPLGFHPADILLHGVLAVVNLALLMWLIPDELGDEAWVPRRRRRRDYDRRRPPAREAVSEPDAQPSPTDDPVAHDGPSRPPPPVGDPPPENPGPAAYSSNPGRSTNPVLSRGAGAVAALAAVIVIVIWMRRR
ncbi:hypothetical protein AWC19_08780 [Mycobacterium palustre]|uniref:DUF4383 domain-containing protein n=1 Tax=Mycobacterium palustre TaxID=153971 RepID=A0A1X1ZMM7_9MYCO|nr:hypothetical protein AWC19_08780 [Mycobacterium palustre]